MNGQRKDTEVSGDRQLRVSEISEGDRVLVEDDSGKMVAREVVGKGEHPKHGLVSVIVEDDRGGASQRFLKPDETLTVVGGD
jgi:hypothetical protein